MSNRKCEGNCDEHRGEVVRVNVDGMVRNWGDFWYCEAARETDRDAGMSVRLTVLAERDALLAALVNLTARLDAHFGGSEQNADWQEQEAARAIIAEIGR